MGPPILSDRGQNTTTTDEVLICGTGTHVPPFSKNKAAFVNNDDDKEGKVCSKEAVSDMSASSNAPTPGTDGDGENKEQIESDFRSTSLGEVDKHERPNRSVIQEESEMSDSTKGKVQSMMTSNSDKSKQDNANDVQSKLELSSTTESENKPSMKSIDCQTSAVIETTVKSENDEIKVDANQAPTTKRKISSTLNRKRKTSLSATRHAMEHYCNF